MLPENDAQEVISTEKTMTEDWTETVMAAPTDTRVQALPSLSTAQIKAIHADDIPASDLLSRLPDGSCIYLARHATPDRTRPDIPYTLPPGPDLAEKGQKEAEELGGFLRDAGVTYIFASPFQRTWQTAHLASAVANIPFQPEQDLSEWEPDESEAQVAARVWRGFADLALRHTGQGPFALVSHGGPVMLLLKQLGVPAAQIEQARIYDSRNPLPPAGAWLIHKDGDRVILRLAFVPQGNRIPDGLEAGVVVQS